jgi:hypothetical protein
MAHCGTNMIHAQARILAKEAIAHLADARRCKAAGDENAWREHMVQAVENAVAGMCLAIDPDYFLRHPIYRATMGAKPWLAPKN